MQGLEKHLGFAAKVGYKVSGWGFIDLLKGPYYAKLT